MTISVLGAGAFGTGLALSLVQNGPVTLWARDPGHARQMAADRTNDKRLPGSVFPDALEVTADIARAAASDTLLLAVPMQALDAYLREHQSLFGRKNLVACCKGIDLTTLTGPTALISDRIPGAIAAILTGPSFAADIARGLPTALTLACADDAAGMALQQTLTTPNLRLYRTTDTVGAELGGALKNIIAIGCGVVIGAGLGESARAALMTRGFAEMRAVAAQMGADPATLTGLSGFGDLALTCTSDKSRNYRFGMALGARTAFVSDVTVEGAATARAALALAGRHGLDVPITRAVTALLDNPETLPQVIAELLSRPLKEE